MQIQKSDSNMSFSRLYATKNTRNNPKFIQVQDFFEKEAQKYDIFVKLTGAKSTTRTFYEKFIIKVKNLVPSTDSNGLKPLSAGELEDAAQKLYDERKTQKLYNQMFPFDSGDSINTRPSYNDPQGWAFD